MHGDVVSETLCPVAMVHAHPSAVGYSTYIVYIYSACRPVSSHDDNHIPRPGWVHEFRPKWTKEGSCYGRRHRKHRKHSCRDEHGPHSPASSPGDGASERASRLLLLLQRHVERSKGLWPRNSEPREKESIKSGNSQDVTENWSNRKHPPEPHGD